MEINYQPQKNSRVLIEIKEKIALYKVGDLTCSKDTFIQLAQFSVILSTSELVFYIIYFFALSPISITKT